MRQSARAKLKKLIDERNETQAEVAEAIGTTQGTLSHILKGDYPVTKIGLAVAIERWSKGHIRVADWLEQPEKQAG
jgi:transcriptional regulator with XRE-family HTH domain